MNFVLLPLNAVATATRLTCAHVLHYCFLMLQFNSFLIYGCFNYINYVTEHYCPCLNTCARISCTLILCTSDWPLEHSVQSLYAALKYDFIFINMQSKHGVFRRQYQKPKDLEPLVSQTWCAHIQHPTCHCCPP
jgi:hypothetical protein